MEGMKNYFDFIRLYIQSLFIRANMKVGLGHLFSPHNFERVKDLKWGMHMGSIVLNRSLTHPP